MGKKRRSRSLQNLEEKINGIVDKELDEHRKRPTEETSAFVAKLLQEVISNNKAPDGGKYKRDDVTKKFVVPTNEILKSVDSICDEGVKSQSSLKEESKNMAKEEPAKEVAKFTQVPNVETKTLEVPAKVNSNALWVSPVFPEKSTSVEKSNTVQCKVERTSSAQKVVTTNVIAKSKSFSETSKSNKSRKKPKSK